MLKKISGLSLIVMICAGVLVSTTAAVEVKKEAKEGPQQVALRVDGNLAGKVSKTNDKSQLIPILAEISFVSKGKVVEKIMSNEKGHFQATELVPGEYVVIARSKLDFGTFAVKVMPYVEIKEESMIRPVSFVEGEEVIESEEIQPEVDDLLILNLSDGPMDPNAPQQPCDCAQPTGCSSCMSGGGGGMGMLPLLGLGGLGGLAGLAGGGGDDAPATNDQL